MLIRKIKISCPEIRLFLPINIEYMTSGLDRLSRKVMRGTADAGEKVSHSLLSATCFSGNLRHT